MVLQQNTTREQGRKAQLGNVTAAKAIADIVRTTLGPRSMLKMLLDANGSIVLTNDGNAILREIDVTHPAAKVRFAPRITPKSQTARRTKRLPRSLNGPKTTTSLASW